MTSANTQRAVFGLCGLSTKSIFPLRGKSFRRQLNATGSHSPFALGLALHPSGGSSMSNTRAWLDETMVSTHRFEASSALIEISNRRAVWRCGAERRRESWWYSTNLGGDRSPWRLPGRLRFASPWPPSVVLLAHRALGNKLSKPVESALLRFLRAALLDRGCVRLARSKGWGSISETRAAPLDKFAFLKLFFSDSTRARADVDTLSRSDTGRHTHQPSLILPLRLQFCNQGRARRTVARRTGYGSSE